MTEPTARDLANAAARQAIADRQAAEYGQVLAWSLGKFGPGWLPVGRHYLVDKQDEDIARQIGERPVAAATCYSVRNATGRRRYFTVQNDKVTEHASWEEAFGDMLMEPHPTMRIEVKGKLVAPPRYSACWASIDLYVPRTAQDLAEARVKREERKVEKTAQENPLFSDMIRAGEWSPEKKPRRR